MRKFVSFGPAFVVLLAVLVTLVAGPALVRRFAHASADAQVVLARQALDDDDILERMNRATVAIAESVEPSVVHVTVGGRGGPGSTGSGWVYDDLGHIVTNSHVVRAGLPGVIRVQFSDGRIERAELVGQDPFTDIAVAKLDRSSGIIPARRATGVRPRQGEKVFAFGSPFGFKFSMSEGIISGLGRDPRDTVALSGFTNYIQTDAAVNPGNSGGPLVDVKGRVIGMNVAIATGRENDGTTDPSAQSAGISFAIPLATIESVVDQIIQSGSVSRGFLGIQYNNRIIEIEDRGEFRGVGLQIGSVSDGSPAHVAGLRSGDVITSIEGLRVEDAEVLRSVVGPSRPGQTIDVVVWRDNDSLTLPVRLGEFPPTQLAEQVLAQNVGIAFEVSDAGPRVLLAQSPFRQTPAQAAGFSSGQVITAVDGRTVETPDEVLENLVAAGLLAGKPVVVRVRDQDSTDARALTIELTPPAVRERPRRSGARGPAQD